MIFVNVKKIHILVAVLFIVEVSCHPKIARKESKTGTINKKSIKHGGGDKKTPVISRLDEDEAKTDKYKKLKLAGSGDYKQIDAKINGNDSDKKLLARSDDLQTLANSVDEEEKNAKLYEEISDDSLEGNNKKSPSGKNCWMNLKSTHFDAMDALDAQYSVTRENYQNEIGNEFENQLMTGLVFQEGAAERAKHQAGGMVSLIPAGINLGGYCMMRMPKSVLFFHRMKLRNQTMFRVNFLHLDLVNMALVVRLSLNDLHLLGAYERSNTERDPSIMYYIPSFGEIQIMMKDVAYKMEGRLRLINNRLLIELIDSEIITKDILMMYVNNNITSEATKIRQNNVAEFVSKLKSDLDSWLKDFFNDYLMYFGHMKNTASSEKILQYEKKKTVLANEYADFVIDSLKKRLKDLGATTVKMPHFTIFSVMNTKIKLHNGVLRGLDSIYRRSVATTRKNGNIRKIDTIVGFSQLKAEYTYDAVTGTGMPPLRGNIILTGDELIAHLDVSQVSDPPTVDIQLDDYVQTKPESLTLEGPGNRMIANFKQVLEHAIVAIMSNSMMYNINMFKSLTRCEPYLHGKDEPNELKSSNEEDRDQSTNDIEESGNNSASSGNDNDDGGDNDEDGDDNYEDGDNDDDVGNNDDGADDNVDGSGDNDDDIGNDNDDGGDNDEYGDNNDDYGGDNDENGGDNDEDGDNDDYGGNNDDGADDNVDGRGDDDDDYGGDNDDGGGNNDSENNDLPSEDNQNEPDMSSDNNQSVEDSDKKVLAEDADYFLTKNDSLEVEVPVNGKVETMKIKSYNEFKVKQVKNSNT